MEKTMKLIVNEALIDAELRRENRISLAKKKGCKIIAATEHPKQATAMEVAFRNAMNKR